MSECRKSTCDHCNVRISESRAPVSTSRRIAAITNSERVPHLRQLGECLPRAGKLLRRQEPLPAVFLVFLDMTAWICAVRSIAVQLTPVEELRQQRQHPIGLVGLVAHAEVQAGDIGAGICDETPTEDGGNIEPGDPTILPGRTRLELGVHMFRQK